MELFPLIADTALSIAVTEEVEAPDDPSHAFKAAGPQQAGTNLFFLPTPIADRC